jgi:N-formylglutamate amidohydrolase
LTGKGYSVARNAPYAGGYTTAHYGRPDEGSHCLQIEINRGLYMDERSFARKPFLARLVEDMREVAGDLAAIEPGLLRPS